MAQCELQIIFRHTNRYFYKIHILIRMFTNFGRELVLSADLCYNEANRKPPSEREVARRSRDGRSLRGFKFMLTSL